MRVAVAISGVFLLGGLIGMMAGEAWSDWRFAKRREAELNELRFTFDKPLPGILRRVDAKTGSIVLWRGAQSVELKTPSEQQTDRAIEWMLKFKPGESPFIPPPLPMNEGSYRIGDIYQSFPEAPRMQFLGGDPRKEESWKAIP